MATAKVAVLVGREPMHRYSVHRGYVDALWAAGATPILLAPPPDSAAVDRYVEAALDCDAVCVTGGGDVDPAWYAAPPEDGLMDVDPLRDGCEVAAVRAARRPEGVRCWGSAGGFSWSPWPSAAPSTRT